ncbi:MAG: alpha/beta hydrolase [Burkholderiales bacterium]|nr:alpha/beta hydrolase [Burkholderiales bacterium]
MATDTPRAEGVAALWIGGRSLQIEYAWIGSGDRDAPLLIFLHEGLGSLSMWRDFPQALCTATGMRGLVYSRPGYGGSTPRAKGEKWPVDFMHRQAHELLPALLEALGIVRPAWLFGHSDGASIALLFAAEFPLRTAGVIAVAPHIFVEDQSIRSIDAARMTYRTRDLRQRLARYHDDPDSAFWGWNDIWLDPAFRDWNIEGRLPAIRCPVLAIQGVDDEYGTMAQVDALARHIRRAELAKFDACGHSPHRDQPAALTATVVDFLRRQRVSSSTTGDAR